MQSQIVTDASNGRRSIFLPMPLIRQYSYEFGTADFTKNEDMDHNEQRSDSISDMFGKLNKEEYNSKVSKWSRTQFKIFEIPAGVSKTQLIDQLKDYGVSEDNLVYHSQNRTQDKRGGVAFFNIVTEQIGNKMMDDLENGFLMNGRKLIVQRKYNKEWPRWQRSIFLKNINSNAEEEQLSALMKNCARWGEILNVKIFRRSDGKCSGIAFIEYIDRETALGAIHMNGEFFMGFPLIVEMKNNPMAQDRNSDNSTDQTSDEEQI